MKFKHLSINCQLSIVNCQLFSYSVILSFILFFSSPLKAQVTIGSQDPPHSFSVLELIAKEKDGGLRLPQLTTLEREALNSQLTGNDEAKGLVVFDTDLNCMEFWNGTKWIGMCSDAMVDCSSTVFSALGSSYTLCADATFSDLTALVGGKELWYDVATGGAAHANTDPLASGATYYAEESVGACVSSTRAPVSVTLGDCSTAPTGGDITTFTNVMYDFQRQTLQAYAGGGIPTGYKWQVSEDNSAFNDIADAPNSNFYNVPAHFADNYANAGTDGLYFRCILSNSAGNTTTSSLNILFISTEDANGNPKGNYGIDPATGIRYLTIQTTNTNFSGTMKFALLSLGQSQNFDGSYNNDAGDLGDLYQWGRVADGHQKVVWKKGIDHVDSILPMTGGDNATSLPFPTGGQTYDATGQINNDGSGHYGNFITHPASSQYWNDGETNLWGNGGDATRAGSDIPLSSWTYPNYQANNPCPGNWSVPSAWDFWDIYNGTGTDASIGESNYTATDNKWSWRDASSTNAIGGAIIANANGEKVFLPAAGVRFYNGALFNLGTYGYYWSSSVYTSEYYGLTFSSDAVSPNLTYDSVNGISVRCVSE